MLKHPDITKKRLEGFAAELKTFLYPKNAPLAKLAVFSAPDRISFAEAMKGKYRPAQIGENFGPGWSTHWFKVEYRVPKEWRGEEVLLHFDSSSEGCVWQDGTPIQALTSYNWGPQDVRSYFTILPQARGSEKGTLYVEAAINGLFGLSNGEGREQSDAIGHLRHARLVIRDRKVWDLLWDFMIIREMACELPDKDVHQGPALTAANAIVNAVILGDATTYAAGRAIARKFLSARNGDRNHHVSAIGHAHIDTAWLWPLAETKRKCYRSFSTAVRMMDEYPEYKFACSQAQQLIWIKEQHPKLYAKIKAKAKSGQFIPVGGTWIEPDCNIPSGESLVRQFLVGQRFFKQEFGRYCEEFWNPDVFGYSGALPQIIRGAGIQFFLTQKLSWNQFNRPPSSTLLWEGIDGSRVLTHFPPTDTYNGICTVGEVQMHITNFKDKERASESLMLFGFGDGGGGPTEEMLERLRRLKNIDGLPDVAIRTPSDFFHRCQEDLKDPIVWSGELYFEMHRGTYTTQAANKRDNRRSEEALHNVEFLSVLAHHLKQAAYPQREIERLWRLVLLNQFHDIIPGSSISEVYVDSARDYADILNSAAKLKTGAVTRILPQKTGSRVLALNTLSWPRREVVSLAGKPVFAEAPAYGYSVGKIVSTTEQPASVKRHARGFTLENGLVRATFDEQGRLSSFLDKRHQRETIAAGTKGNQYALFEDKPNQFEAWDVDIFHLEKPLPVGEASEIRVVQENPLRVAVEVKIALTPRTSLVQRIVLDADSARLNFEVKVDWREKQKILKVEFPLALRSDYATYEIQFGHVRRPTHFNTSWDFARFEVSGHRWADLSEPAFGVALLNDSKYGYSCLGNVLSLSLLRATQYPDRLADIGSHQFKYALYPHAHGPQLGGVIEEATFFNQPLEVFPTDADPQSHSFFGSDNPAIVIDTVKQAEDGDAIILRLYESHGSHQTANLTSAFDLEKVATVNLLEEPSDRGGVRLTGNRIRLSLRPFEIVTLKLIVGQES